MGQLIGSVKAPDISDISQDKDIPATNMSKDATTMGKAHILGIPFCDGQPKGGTELAPEALKQPLHDVFSSTNTPYEDCGDVCFTENDASSFGVIKKPMIVGSGNKEISRRVTEVMNNMGPDDICINLGGDHSVAIGTIHGHMAAHKDAVVVWVDAHADINPADINPPSESPTGNIHGMPLAFLIHDVEPPVPKGLPGFDWLKPCLKAKDLAYIGLRSVDPSERRVLAELGITFYDMREVDQLGIKEVVKQVLQKLNPDLDRPIHLSFDIEGLDPCHAPSTGTRETDGLTLREGAYIVESLHKTGKLRCLDLVEVNPSLGSPEDVQLTLQSTCHLVSSMCGGWSAHQ